MEENKENVDTFDADKKDTENLEQYRKSTEDDGNTTKTLTNLEDIPSRDKKRHRSSFQKRVSFGASQIKIFQRNEDEWNDAEEDTHYADWTSSKNASFSVANSDMADTITIPSLSSLLQEGEYTEWKLPPTGNYPAVSSCDDDDKTSKEENAYSEDTEEFEDFNTNTNNSLSFFMDEDISKAAKLPRVSLGDTTIFPSTRRAYENDTPLNSSKQETKDYHSMKNASSEITENIPKLQDILGEDETLTSNWESVRKSIETYQNPVEDTDDADLSFERMYGRVFGSPSGKEGTDQLYTTREMTVEITKSIPSLRMLMEEDTTVSLPRMPVNASDLKNVQRQIQMDDTEDKRISEVEQMQANDDTESHSKAVESGKAAEEEEDWSISTTDFKNYLQAERDQNELVSTMEESNRDYTWPVSRPQTDNEDWTLQGVASVQESSKGDKTPKFRFVKKPPVYTPSRKVQTESKDNRIAEHHEPISKNNSNIQEGKHSSMDTPSPCAASTSKENRYNSTTKSSGLDRKQSLEFRRKSIAAHVKRLSTQPYAKSSASDSTPSNTKWNSGHWDSIQKQEAFGDDEDSGLHALTEIFMTNENEMNKNSVSKQTTHNLVSEFLQEAKVRFLDNVSSRRRQTSYGVYTTDDRSSPENEESKILAATGSYGWLKTLEGLCERLEASCTETENQISATENSLNREPPELLFKVSKKDFPKQQLTRLQISMKRLKNFCRLEARCRWYERRLAFERELASELEYWISCLKEELQTMDSHIESLERLSSSLDEIAESEKLRMQSSPLSTEEQRKLEPIIASLHEQESVREGFLQSIESLENEIQHKEEEKQKIEEEGSYLSKRRQSLEQYVLSSSDAVKSTAKHVQERFELHCRLLGISIRQISNESIDIDILNRLKMKIRFTNNRHLCCESKLISNASSLNNCIAPFIGEPFDDLSGSELRRILWSTIYKLTLVNLIETQLKAIKSQYVVNVMDSGPGFVVEVLFASSRLGCKFSVGCKCENLWHISPIEWELKSIFGQCERVFALKEQLDTFVSETCPLLDGMKAVRQFLAKMEPVQTI